MTAPPHSRPANHPGSLHHSTGRHSTTPRHRLHPHTLQTLLRDIFVGEWPLVWHRYLPRRALKMQTASSLRFRESSSKLLALDPSRRRTRIAARPMAGRLSLQPGEMVAIIPHAVVLSRACPGATTPGTIVVTVPNTATQHTMDALISRTASSPS